MFDTMTFTKILGGFCGALLVFLLGQWAAELIYHKGGGYDYEQAYVIDTGEDETEEAEVEEGPSFEELFVQADVGKGERVFNKCKACHMLEEGANGAGPYLYGVVGREVASAEGFGYSGNLAPVVDVWTPQELSAFLENPSGYAPGTTMGFAGLDSMEDRANVIAYMDQTDGDTYEIEMPASEDAPADEGAAAEEATEEEATEEQAPEDAAQEQANAADVVTTEEPEVAEVEPTPAAEADAEQATGEAAAETGSDESQQASAEGTEDAATEEGATEEAATEEAAAEAPAAEESAFAAMVAAADPAEGQQVYRQCQACHVADKEQNRVGPHLVGLLGREIASVDGFRYSDALSGLEGAWTADELNAWLENPREYAPGNRMSYAGLRDEADRAAVIAYIESLSN